MSLFSRLKTNLYKNYGESPGKMLVHTGVLGWILSSLAQITAVVFNDKISPEQKSFLIPQEIADAAVNILSFYCITSSFKNVASKLVSTGKLTTKSIKNALLKSGVDKSRFGKFDFDIGKLNDVPEGYKSFKNGIDVTASIIGSVISSNIVTPILRNKYASAKQKEMVGKMHSNTNNLKAPRTVTMAQFQNQAYSKYSLKI